MNTIIGGEYKGAKIKISAFNGLVRISYHGKAEPLSSLLEEVTPISSEADHKAVMTDALLLGAPWALARASKKNHLVELKFKDGKKALAELDSTVFKAVMSQSYGVNKEEEEAWAKREAKKTLFSVAFFIFVLFLFFAIFSL